MDNALQMSIDCILTEDEEPMHDTLADTTSQQDTAPHWLPSVNSHAPA